MQSKDYAQSIPRFRQQARPYESGIRNTGDLMSGRFHALWAALALGSLCLASDASAQGPGSLFAPPPAPSRRRATTGNPMLAPNLITNNHLMVRSRSPMALRLVMHSLVMHSLIMHSLIMHSLIMHSLIMQSDYAQPGYAQHRNARRQTNRPLPPAMYGNRQAAFNQMQMPPGRGPMPPAMDGDRQAAFNQMQMPSGGPLPPSRSSPAPMADPNFAPPSGAKVPARQYAG